MVVYEKQPILDKFQTVLNFFRHISYSIMTLFRGLLSSSVLQAHNIVKLRLVYYTTSWSRSLIIVLGLGSIYFSNRAGMMSLIKVHSTVMCIDQKPIETSRIHHWKITYLFQLCYNNIIRLNLILIIIL